MRINAEEAKRFMDEHPNAVVFDVRRENEYQSGHVPGAKLLTNEEISKDAVAGFSKEQPVLIYCRTGRRSKQAAKKLTKLGFTQVYDFGGIVDWPYETE